MKSWIKVLLALLVAGIGSEISAVNSTAHAYDIRNEFTFSDMHSFDIVKNSDLAEAKLSELKLVFDEVPDVEIKLEKTGSEGLDIFMAYYTGEQADALNEIYWNAHELTYEAYWNELVEDLRIVSRQISAEVGDYYGVGIAIDIGGIPEVLLLVTGGLVMDDKVNVMNYDPHYIDLFY